MMWNILAEQHHLTEILLTCPLSGEGGDSEYWTQHGVVIKQIIIRALHEDHYNMSSKEQLQPWTTAFLSGHNKANLHITQISLCKSP